MRETRTIVIDGEKLKAEIIKHGETQKTIADKIGVDPSTICKYIKNNKITMLSNCAIAGILGVPADAFEPDAPADPQKTTQDQKFDAMIEKLDFINRNICELIDAVEKLVTTFQ